MHLTRLCPMSFCRSEVLFRTLSALFLLSCLSIPAVAQQPSLEVTLMRENRRLRQTIDSLKRELERATAEDILWSGLSGLEEDIPGAGSGVSTLGGALDDAAREIENILSLVFPETAPSYHPSVGERIAALSRGRAAVRLERSRERLESRMPFFREVFVRHGVPAELIPLCIVESAVSPHAVSDAGAAGLWQLMPATARQYGLRVDAQVDERFDERKSTDAAARLLADLRKELGSWPLAVMAYNCGAARVRRAVILAGGTDPWGVRRHVPEETRAYLPSLLAVGCLMVGTGKN